mmetsp:Transcript_3469/g.2471  ORF Transcript_3469/g.2471 Transcript_3469/m.2471 type:complete len:90 (-) Transcript_3469:1555-1824(-)
MKSGKHECIGGSIVTLQELKGHKQEYEIKSEKKGKRMGEMKVKAFHLTTRYTFLQYVFGGCDINLVIAIDFTLSNGSPNDRDSLHYFDL